MKGTIIFYKLDSLKPNSKEKVLRGLFGKEQQSYYGKYKYRIGGILDDIPNYKPTRGSVIILKKDEKKVINFLESNKVEYEIYSTSVNKRLKAETYY